MSIVTTTTVVSMTARRRRACGEMWTWKPQLPVHYQRYGAGRSGEEKRTCSNNTESPAVLMIPGFGVGSYHYRNNAQEIADYGLDVYCMDLMGQGKSWPEDSSVLHGSSYSISLWIEQIEDFVLEKIQGPVVLIGNSLGGFLAAAAASETRCKDAIKGVILLNPTPFWGRSQASLQSAQESQLQNGSQRNDTSGGTIGQNSSLASFTDWDGRLPVPTFNLPVTIARYIAWNIFKTEIIEDFIDLILEPTYHPRSIMAEEAFLSILFSSSGGRRLEPMLSNVGCPVCLIYGRDDPWVVPLWGQRAKRARPDADYYEISDCGHCPHHERPLEVNTIVRHWFQKRRYFATEDDSLQNIDLPSTVKELEGDPRNVFDWLARKYESTSNRTGEDKDRAAKSASSQQ